MMNITVTKGPNWKEAEKNASQYLYKLLVQKVNVKKEAS